MSRFFCLAVGCGREVQPKILMCRWHWFAVPRWLQDLVAVEYRPGQETDGRPSLRYLVVQKTAVERVARAEGARAAADRLREERDALLARCVNEGLGNPLLKSIAKAKP